MKFLVVYYTRSGNTKLVAEEIAKILNCEMEELVDLKNRNGILGWLLSGHDAITKKLTEIKPITKNLDLYEHIILCSPVWALTVPPAVRTFLSNYKEKIKNISFVATMNAIGAEKMFNELENMFGKKPIFTVAINRKDIKTNNYLEKINRVVRNLVS